MAGLIIAEDRIEAAALRQDSARVAQMWKREMEQLDRILAAGSLRADHGVAPIGSLTILDAVLRAVAEAIWVRGPAARAGMRQPAVIRFWNPTIVKREVLP